MPKKKFRDLLAALPPERQVQIERETEQLLAEMPLHDLRRARELSQEYLATAMQQGQSAISRLERRTDMYISTLRRYIRALGGELDIIARFPEGSVRVDLFSALGSDERGIDVAELSTGDAGEPIANSADEEIPRRMRGPSQSAEARAASGR